MAAARSLGPATVANRAPTVTAKALASSQSDSGATTTNSSNAAAAPTASPSTVARQSLSNTATLRPARLRASCT